MSTPDPIVEVTSEDADLDAFNDLFHGKTKEAPAPEPKDDGPVDEAETEDNDAPIEHEETQEPEDDADLAPEDEENEAPKPKTRLEKRIEKLLENERVARERADRLEAELRKTKEIETPKPVPTTNKAPHFDDKNEDGTDKYPLGQFDPSFQEDHVKHLLAEGLAAQKAQLEQEAQEKEARQAQETLTNAWNEKLEPAKERYPDFQEKGQELLGTFSGIPQDYGEYLTATIMSLDNGPDVLYYLSNNIDEAERIIRLGATGAAIALGRIDARFEADVDVEEKPKPRPRVSKAPPPAPTNRGSSAALAEVPDDTDDLDAFAAKMFKKR